MKLFIKTIIICGLFAPVSVAHADIKIARQYYDQKEYKKAFSEYMFDAKEGNADAQFNLGNMYKHGYGVVQDYKQAVMWLRKAAEQGYAKGQYKLGVMYDNSYGVAQDYKQAAMWYRKAADQGYVSAQYNLGVMYSSGEGVAQDYKQAIMWYRKAADQGYAKAQTELGIMMVLKKKRLKYNKVKNNLRTLNVFLESKSCTYTNTWKVKKHLKDAICNDAIKTYEKLFESETKHIIAISVEKNKAAISKLGLKKEILESGFFGIKFREALAILMDSPKNKIFIENAIFFGDFILIIKQKHTPAMKWGFKDDYGDLKYTSTNITADGIKDLMVNYDGSGYIGKILLEGEINSAIKSIIGIK